MRSIAWLVLLLVSICALAGQPMNALLLLSVSGMAGLLVVGFRLAPIQTQNGVSARAAFTLQNLSAKVAVTDAKGRLLFATAAFKDAAGLLGDDTNIHRLGGRDPDGEAAMHRLFDAARGKRKQTEMLRLSGKDISLSVAPVLGDTSQSPAFEWIIDGLSEAEPLARSISQSDESMAFAGKAPVFTHSVWSDAPFAAALINPAGQIVETNIEFRKIFEHPGLSTGAGAVKLRELVKEDVALGQFLASSRQADVKTEQAIGVRHDFEVWTRSSRSRRIRLTAMPSPSTREIMLFATETGVAAILDEQTVQNQKLQAVGELAGGIAHDFNNLLTSIIGFSDLLLARFRQSDPAFKDLMNIKNNANRAAGLVSQILAYSRKQTLRPTLVVLTDVIQDFHSSVGRLLGEKITAKIDHGRDLWFVKADEHQLFQVIMNLAVNARDAMPDGGTLSLRTANVTNRDAAKLKNRGLPPGEYVLCEVRDTGTGIAPEHLQRIFDPFFSTKEVGKGTGLGLSTVYGIVKQTGGTILVDSEPGAGTTFSIYLPRHRETEDELAARLDKGTQKAATADLTGSSTVLLVEDEESVRSFASRALTSRGYKVLEAGSGVEALEVMDREGATVDLVVSDVVMPEMDGPTLLRHLRQRNPKIKIVFMSGYAEEAFRKNLDPGEAFTFLPKPFTLKTLAETVKAAAA